MMPISETVNQSTLAPKTESQSDYAMATTPQGESVNYRKKYKILKRKMRMLVYEQECFTEELKKAQRKLLKVSRDRSFLLDRLLQYEKLEDTSDDSDATATSDSEAEGIKEPVGAKKKKGPNQTILSLPGSSVSLLPGNLSKQQASWLMSGGAEKAIKGEPAAKRKATKVTKKAGKSGVGSSGPHGASGTGTMTREELERHLELKQSAKPQFMSLDAIQTPYSLPEDIFSHDNSNQDGDLKDEPGVMMIHHTPR